MNAHTRLKPPPPGFAEIYIRWGWRGVETFFGSRTACNKRWIEQHGPELKQARQTYRQALARQEQHKMTRIDHTAFAARCTSEFLITTLTDGREIWAPLEWFPVLESAHPAERIGCKVIDNGETLHWPALGENVSVRFLLGTKGGVSDV